MDLIDRQAAIDVCLDGWNKGYEEILADIRALPSAQPEDCDTCKHGYFGDEQCNSCRVRFTSHYERRTDECTD